MSGLLDTPLRVVLTAVHSLMKTAWFFRRPKTFGAHAIALTPEGRIILVKLRYAPGWRLPGGGRPEREDPVQAALRELREEIGMTVHGDVALTREFKESTDFKRDTASLVFVRDVEYRPPRWSWEVERVAEFDPGQLPEDVAPITARWLSDLRPLL